LSVVAAELLADLDVIRIGRGIPLLLLHGPTPVAAELPFMVALSRHAEIIAPSHPGFGGSARPDEFDSMYDLVRLYLDMLERLPYDEVVVVGLSFGAWLAAEIATVCSHKLTKLILVDAVGVKLGGRTERDITHLFNTPPAELEARSWHDPTRRPRGPFGLGWQMHVEEFADDALVQLARNWDALCLYAWRPHLFNPHLKPWLHRIRVPTLVIWGAADRIVSPDYGRAYCRLISQARFEVIEGAGHHPELEQPEAFVQLVADFLQEPGE
jgi:pimeloyl-ACP methyl ester carboxylesterase